MDKTKKGNNQRKMSYLSFYIPGYESSQHGGGGGKHTK
jgi:hypothetical protein